jgi:hypothetical protein
MKSLFEFRFLIFDFRVGDRLSTRRPTPPEFRKSAIINRQSKIIMALFCATTLTASASHFDGSRTVPVHKIALTDEEGQKIISTVPGTMPFSAKLTCGACHDYKAIHSGSHFSGTGQGRPTEPWIIVDEKSGTQIPADRMNLSAWEFTRQFGHHLPGGGLSDPADQLTDPDARWEISGGLEINCLACHNNAHRQDATEWAKQMGRENFRWAATAASGMGEVDGMASRMPGWWNIYDGENPDDHVFAVPPSVDYDTTLFDSKHRMWFDIGKPQDSSCLHCHSTYPVGTPRMDVHGDVHAAAGLACIDCHKNGEDHQILRGTTDAMSCESCHMQTGQLGAPIAAHKGLPPIHFETMTCTACHSGAKPEAAPQRVRTSRANRLGIYGRAQWFTESPFIVEPIFVRNDEGKIEPRRMVWPAFWAYSDGIPLDEDLVAEGAVGVLDTEQQVAAVLGKFARSENAPGEPLFAANGKLYRRNADGGLDLAGKMNTPHAWLWDTETNLVATLPDFDVNAEEIDYDAEGAIVAIMEALKPLEIVVVTKGNQFVKNAEGYLVGTNTALASGWYTQDGAPLVSAFAQRAVIDTVGTEQALNEEQVALMLKKLGSTACYMANGRKFSLNEAGELVDEDHASAAPVSWPLGHDVRSTAQSLGAKTCQECHAPDSNFLFGTVTATGPLLTDRSSTVSMHEFQEVEGDFNRLFGLTFKVRNAFKTTLGILAALLGLIVLAVGLPAIYKLVTKLDEKNLPTKPVRIGMIAALIVLAITGFGFGWPISYPLNGFPLLSHVGFGALFAMALTVWALLRAKSGGNAWFWLLVVCGIVLILSILIAMFPILGTHGQHVAIVVHRVAAILSMVAALMGGLTAKKKGF